MHDIWITFPFLLVYEIFYFDHFFFPFFPIFIHMPYDFMFLRYQRAWIFTCLHFLCYLYVCTLSAMIKKMLKPDITTAWPHCLVGSIKRSQLARIIMQI